MISNDEQARRRVFVLLFHELLDFGDETVIFGGIVAITKNNGAAFHGGEFLNGTCLFTEQFLPHLVFLRGGEGGTKFRTLEGSIPRSIVVGFTKIASESRTRSIASRPAKLAVNILLPTKGGGENRCSIRSDVKLWCYLF